MRILLRSCVTMALAAALASEQRERAPAPLPARFDRERLGRALCADAPEPHCELVQNDRLRDPWRTRNHHQRRRSNR